MKKGHPWGLMLAISLLVSVLAVTLSSQGAHKPFYKFSSDELVSGEWEAHFVWLRSPHFNYVGSVYWELEVVGEGTVDVFFLEWAEFQKFIEGQTFRTLIDPLRSVGSGAQRVDYLDPDSPYFLIIQNQGLTALQVTWVIYADIDWRRWQGQDPGPTFNVVPVDESPMLALDESWTMTFDEPGYYRYYCFPHAEMTGLVEVVASASPEDAWEVAIRDFGFHPEVIRLAQGTSIRWTNLDGVEHSVRVEVLPDGISGVAPEGSLHPLQIWWPLALVPLAGLAALYLYRRTRVS